MKLPWWSGLLLLLLLRCRGKRNKNRDLDRSLLFVAFPFMYRVRAARWLWLHGPGNVCMWLLQSIGCYFVATMLLFTFISFSSFPKCKRKRTMQQTAKRKSNKTNRLFSSVDFHRTSHRLWYDFFPLLFCVFCFCFHFAHSFSLTHCAFDSLSESFSSLFPLECMSASCVQKDDNKQPREEKKIDDRTDEKWKIIIRYWA